MMEHESDGHCCIRYDDLVDKSQKLLEISKKAVVDQLAILLESEELCTAEVEPQKYSRMPHLFDITT